MSKRALSTVATRHQVFLERLKTQVSRDFTKVLPELEKAIRDVVFELQIDTLSDLSARRLKTLLEELRFVQGELIAGAKQNLLDDLRGLSKYEAGFEQRSLQAATDAAKKGQDLHGYEVSGTPAKDAFDAALKRPMSATGHLLEDFVDTWGTKQLDGVETAVQRAWGEGRTIGQLVTEIRGTRAGGYKDGLIEASRRQAEAVARTATQHVAQTARQAVWEENGDLVEGVIFVATLDSRTTTQCRSLDGKEFPLDSGPRPPLHVNCRSTTIAKLPKELDFLDKGATRSSASGYVPADQTYYEWLKGQPASFQDEALGADRASLFRDGGLSSDAFAKLNLDRNFQPITLEAMAAKEPTAFESAGLDDYLPPKK